MGNVDNTRSVDVDLLIDHTGDADIEQGSYLPNPFEGIPPEDVNVKKIKKAYRRRFEKFRILCRMKVTGTHKTYNYYSDQIMDLFGTALKNLDNIENGNIVVLIFILDNLLETLMQLSKRVRSVRDKELLKSGSDIVLKKQSEVVKVFTDNLRKPVTLEEFESYMKSEGDTESESTDTETIGG